MQSTFKYNSSNRNSEARTYKGNHIIVQPKVIKTATINRKFKSTDRTIVVKQQKETG